MLTLTRVRSVGEALRDTIVTHKTNVALIEADRHRENGRWTYRQLRAEAERVGALLQRHGFGSGDRCAILMQNQSKWLFTATGAFWAGAVVVPIDYKLTAAEQLALLGHCKPAVLVTEYSRWLELQGEAKRELADTIVLVTEAPADATLADGTMPDPTMGPAKTVERWETDPQAALQVQERDRDDVACIVYSSGTSGTPKGCMLTHANYLEQAESLGRLFPIDEDDRYFSVLPTNHAIDFMVGYILPLLFGAAVVHQRTLRPQFLRASIKQYGITHMALVPTILENLKKRIEERLDDLPEWQRRAIDALERVNVWATARGPNQRLSATLLKPIHDELGGKLKKVFAGGTFVDRDLAQFFYDLGIPVVIGYGMTEATTVITVNDLKPFRPDTVGKPVDRVEVQIREPNEEGVGEVWVRGPTVMKGYLDAPELTAETIVDGWLRTGDMGSVDVSGHLQLRGRSKNMIVTKGGKNIYPEDIEGAFDNLPGCEELCVFAANYIWPTQSMTGEQLIVVVRPENQDVLEDLVTELRSRNRRLSDFKRVGGYVVVDEEFPRTASQKVKRGVLAKQLGAVDRGQTVRALEG